MNEATIAQTILSGLFGAIFLGFFIWGFVTGQFRNVEEASRRMLKNNLPEQNSSNKKTGDKAKLDTGGEDK
jgi:nitrogen fixation-related uncharacterized protein